MNLIDDYLAHIIDSKTLESILKQLNYDTTQCRSKESPRHLHCYQYENQLPIPQCPQSLLYLVISLIGHNPDVVRDDCRTLVSQYFKSHVIKAKCIINMPNLHIIKSSKSQTLAWVGFELLLIRLIQDKVYEPKTMCNEVLSVLKNELPIDIGVKLSSVIKSCVVHCKKASDNDAEEKEKWCEMLDWMSWFIVDEPRDLTD